MAGFVDSKPTISMYLRNNLMSLFMLHPSRKEVEDVLKEDNLFAVPQKKAMQDIFHFLLPIMFQLKIVSKSTYHWPILNREDETRFRTTVRSVLLELVTNHPDSSLPKINASFLTNPGGDKFIHFMWKLTLFLLDKNIQSLRGASRLVRCIDPDDDDLIDVKLKMFQSLAVEETRRYAEQRMEISRLKDTAREVAKELIAEIKLTGVQCAEAETRLTGVTAAAPISDEERRGLGTDRYPEVLAEWEKRAEERRAEVEALMSRASACQARLAGNVSRIRSAVEGRRERVCLDGGVLRARVPPAVRAEAGGEDLPVSLHTVDGALDLRSLTVAGCLAISLLSRAAPAVPPLARLAEAERRAAELDAYLSAVEPAMTEACASASRAVDRLYERLGETQQQPRQLEMMVRGDEVLEAMRGNTTGSAFPGFVATPEQGRNEGLMKVKPSCPVPRTSTRKPVGPSVRVGDVSVVNTTLDSTINRSQGRPCRYANTGMFRMLLERAQSERSLLSERSVIGERSVISERSDILVGGGDNPASVFYPQPHERTGVPTDKPTSVLYPQHHEHLGVLFAGEDNAANSCSPNVTGCPSELNSTPGGLGVSVECSFLGHRLLDSHRSDETTVISPPVFASPPAMETPPKTSSPLESPSTARPPLASSFALGLRRHSSRPSPFPAVPKDSTLSPVLSLSSVDSPRHCPQSSFGDSLSDSDIVHFSPLLVRSPPAATEDVTPQPPPTPLTSHPRRGRSSLDAIIERYRRIKERATTVQPADK